jgi:hypothetical protein
MTHQVEGTYLDQTGPRRAAAIVEQGGPAKGRILALERDWAGEGRNFQLVAVRPRGGNLIRVTQVRREIQLPIQERWSAQGAEQLPSNDVGPARSRNFFSNNAGLTGRAAIRSG